MSNAVVVYEKSHAVMLATPDQLDLEYLNSRLLREKLIIVAPSEKIWIEYADSVGWKAYTEHGGNGVIKHGEQLIGRDMPIGPVVLVVGLPLDLESRLAVIGALTEMTPAWEAQGGRVLYVRDFQPSIAARSAAGADARLFRSRRVEREIRAAGR